MKKFIKVFSQKKIFDSKIVMTKFGIFIAQKLNIEIKIKKCKTK